MVVIGNKYDLDGIRDVDVNVSTQWAKTNGGKRLGCCHGDGLHVHANT